MGLFDFLKRKDSSVHKNKQHNTVKASIPENDKKYYQPDEYYTVKAHEGTMFEHTVITFDERKKTCIPSKNGLYVAEILLLEYCSNGTYPKPKNGYPGFWWFEYGIRDVGLMLKSLEERGFIELASVKESVGSLTVTQLKDLLIKHNIPTSGKKADLIKRVSEAISEKELIEAGVEQKYVLTETGKQELADNAYVPYMHKCPSKTVEDETFGEMYNVWSVNKLLGNDDKSKWKEIVENIELRRKKETEKRNEQFMKELKEYDSEGYAILKAQDDQLAIIQKAEAKYQEDRDIDSYIRFWENIWKNGGLLFEGSGWHFVLADLYIKTKRYNAAFRFLNYLKDTKNQYADKADTYILRIQKIMEKEF